MKKEYVERTGLLASLALADHPWSDFEDAYEIVQNAPADDVEREYIESLLKRHAAYLLATIDNKGTHVGKFDGIALDTDGNWIIEADVESLSATDCGDFAPVVHGEWVEGAEHFTNGCYDAECNKCGTYISWNNGNSGDWNFCPNCGAKMDGGKIT